MNPLQTKATANRARTVSGLTPIKFPSGHLCNNLSSELLFNFSNQKRVLWPGLYLRKPPTSTAFQPSRQSKLKCFILPQNNDFPPHPHPKLSNEIIKPLCTLANLLDKLFNLWMVSQHPPAYENLPNRTPTS